MAGRVRGDRNIEMLPRNDFSSCTPTTPHELDPIELVSVASLEYALSLDWSQGFAPQPATLVSGFRSVALTPPPPEASADVSRPMWPLPS